MLLYNNFNECQELVKKDAMTNRVDIDPKNKPATNNANRIIRKGEGSK